MWKTFNDALSDSNSNQIPSGLRDICLKSQIYASARDICSSISDEELLTTEGVKSIFDCIYHRDAFPVVREAFR